LLLTSFSLFDFCLLDRVCSKIKKRKVSVKYRASLREKTTEASSLEKKERDYAKEQ